MNELLVLLLVATLGSGAVQTDVGARAEAERALAEGRAQREAGDFARAAVHLERAARLAGSSDLGLIAGEAWFELSFATRSRGDFELEREQLARAREITERIPDADAMERDALRARILLRTGIIEREAGRAGNAIRLYGEALTLAERTGSETTEVDVLGKRSAALLGLARYDEALADAQRAYGIASGGDQPRFRAATIFALAQVHAHLWDLERAAALWTQAIDAYDAIGFERAVSLSRRQRMDTWFALGDLDRAAQDGDDTLRTLGPGSARVAPGVWARMAHIEARRGRHERAAHAAERALGAIEQSNHPAYVWNELAMTALTQGELDVAEERFERVLQLARAAGDRENEWRARDGLGRVAYARGAYRNAAASFASAVNVIDEMRRAVPHPNLRGTLVSGRLGPYERLVASLVAQSRQPSDRFAMRALEVAESARGRTLSEIVRQASVGADEPTLSAIRRDEDAWLKRISELQARLRTTSDEAAHARLSRELDTLELEYDAFVAGHRRRHSFLSEWEGRSALTASEMRDLAAEREALLVFFVGDDAGVAWLIRHDESTSYPIPGRAELDERVSLLLGLVSAGDRDARAPSQKLYEALVAPAEDALRTAERLVVVPAGPLARLPLALLRDGNGRFLAERVSLSRVPSIKLLAELRARPRPHEDRRSALVLASSRSGTLYDASDAFPPLAEAKREAQDVRRALAPWSVTLLVDDQASENHLDRLEMDSFRLMHFAAHAAVDDVVPRRSALLLASDAGPGESDGLFQFQEIARLRMSPELVVISSCRSHMGQPLRGEGFMSLGRGFLYAGARAVAASVWPVSDRETRTLMGLFYANLAQAMPADVALATAQRQMLQRGGRSAEPRSWAGFVLTGDVNEPPIPVPLAKRFTLGWAVLVGVAAMIGIVLVARFKAARS